MRRFRWLALLLALTLIAAACGGDDDNDDDAAVDTPSGEEEEAAGTCDATVPGSQVNYGVFAPTANLDPPYVSGALVGGTEIANIYDVLFTFDFESNSYEPRLAESIEPNDDNSVWTLKLRDGITYSDGTALDAQLVSDNLDRFFAEDVRNGSGGFLAQIESKSVVDDLTLEITLKGPWAEFPFVFSDEPGMIVNTNAIGDDPEAFRAQPPEAAGVGPYVVERNVPGEELVLKARDDYWNGPVCIETLRFVFVPGTQGTYEAFQSGELDVAFLRDAAVNEEAKSADDPTFFVRQESGEMLMFNHTEGRATANEKVRRAIMLAVDPAVINERAYQGALTTYKAIASPDSRFYSDAMEELPTDADEASSLVEEAKAEGWDGSLELLCTDAGARPETGLAIEGMLEAVGFDVSIRSLPVAEQIGEVIAGNFDAACFGLNAGPETAITTFVRSYKTGPVGSNRNRYSSPEMDTALDAVLAANSEEELQEAMAEINRLNNEDAVNLIYGHPEEGIVYKDSITGIVPTTSTIFLFGDAHIEE